MADKILEVTPEWTATLQNGKPPQCLEAPLPQATPVQLPELPEPFLRQLVKCVSQEDAKALRSTCSRLCSLCNSVHRLSSLKASALLLDAPPTLSYLPHITFLDFHARNAACSHQLLAALRQHGSRLVQSVSSVRLSGRDGLLAALQTLRLACPNVIRLEVRCQHSYRGRNKECADLGRCLRELETAFPALTELHLHRFPISSSQLIHLCDTLTGLRALSVRGLAHALTSDSLAHLHRLSQLVSLSIDHLQLRGRRFPCGPQLRSLELSDATITAESFATLNSLTGLQSLSLWGTGHRSALAFTPLSALVALRRLHLELVLDGDILAGLKGCTSLTSLSAQTARVVAVAGSFRTTAAAAASVTGQPAKNGTGATAVSASDGEDGDAGVGAVAAVDALPPYLSSVMRLSLESLAKDCLPLSGWLPGLRSLVLLEDDGSGAVWRAVAGHECLTSLQVAEGGCLPRRPCRAPELEKEPDHIVCAARGAEDVRCEALIAGGSGGLAVGSAAQGGTLVPLRVSKAEASLSQTHHHHQHRQQPNHHHGFRGMHHLHTRLERYLGGNGNGDSSDGETSSNSSDSGSSSVRSSSDGGRINASCTGSIGVCNSDIVATAPKMKDGGAVAPHSSWPDHSTVAPCGNRVTTDSHSYGALPAAAVDDGIQQLTEPSVPLPPPRLAHLRLAGCEGLPEQEYASCVPLPAMTSCNLSGCACLTTAGLAHLLGCMPALQELSLEGAPHLTDEALVGLVAGAADVGGAPLDSVFRWENECGNGGQGALAGGAIACSPSLAAAVQAAATATGMPVPPCSACAGVAAGAPQLAEHQGAAGYVSRGGIELGPVGISRSSSAAALAAAAAMCGRGKAAGMNDTGSGTVMGLRRLELSRLPLVTARGVAAAAAGLTALTALRVASCQAVCREACVWLPQQLGRPSLSVVCSHAPVYEDH